MQAMLKGELQVLSLQGQPQLDHLAGSSATAQGMCSHPLSRVPHLLAHLWIPALCCWFLNYLDMNF